MISSNAPVNATVIPRTFLNERWHLEIPHGVPIFIFRDKTCVQQNCYVTLTLAQLNSHLAAEWTRLITKNDQGELVAKDTEVASILDDTKGFPEDRLAEELALLANTYDRRLGATLALSASGILTKWNYFGVVSNVTATGTLNVVVGGVGRVSNIWTKVANGDSIYLVLKRSSEQGPFQFVPYATKPTLKDLQYTSLNGAKSFGHVIYIGQVADNNGIEMRAPSETLWKGSSADAYTAALECRNTISVDLTREIY